MCASDSIPQTNSIVPTPTGNVASIRAEGDTVNVVCMPSKGLLERACGNIPQADGTVPTPTGNGASIRAEGNAVNSVHISCER